MGALFGPDFAPDPEEMGKHLGKIGISIVWISFFLLTLSFLLFPPDLLCASYTFTDIHPPGWVESRVLSLNARNEAVGFGVTASGERGFLWSSGIFTEILPPGADGARALYISDSGEIAGFWVKDGVRHAFLLRGGAYLDPAPGWAHSEATYVGEDGTVGGTGEFGAFVSRRGVTEILPGFSVVVAGNSSGKLVGNGDNAARLYLPNYGYRDLAPPGTDISASRGINENGRVAIVSEESGADKGFVFSDPFFVSMTPPGWSSSRATAINNLETVAGCGDSPEGRRSFLRSGASYEILSFPGWLTTEAEALNDLGFVAGHGTTASGETHAFIASPESGASGGCVMAPRGAGDGPDDYAAADRILTGFPMLPLLWRRVKALRFRRRRTRKDCSRTGAGEIANAT